MSDFDIRYSALRRAVIENEFEKLNDMQKKAVFKTEGPVLLLAGAGSGKTTVLINRVINLLRFGRGYECETAPDWAGDAELAQLAQAVADPGALPESGLLRLCAVDAPRPWEIIAITFTNKAAGELRDRLNVACGPRAADIWAHTFHSACTRILRRDIDRLGYSRSFTIYDEDDKKRMLTGILKDLDIDEKKFELRGISSEISRAKDNLVDPAEYEELAGSDYYKRIVSRVYTVYQKRMLSANALDFDDIIVKTVELLRGFADVREYYQDKFRYVLVDEYQDTNHAQYVLCSILAGKHRNLCVVGDDDQSIYKFRGATIANILEFEQQYPEAVTIRLEQNYRSTGNILSAANEVIACNTARKGKTLWTRNAVGERVHLYVADTQDDEAQYVASRIHAGYMRGEKLNSFAVLYRNHALSNSIESAFKRNGIPYRIVSGLRFFDRAEVKDMLAYLWVIHNPSDSVRLRRVINNPARKIGAKTLETLALLEDREGIPQLSLASRADEFPDFGKSAAAALRQFADLIASLQSLAGQMPLPDFYEEVMEKTGYLPALEAQDTIEARGRIDNIRELKSSIVEYCERAENPTLGEFLEEISLLTDVDRYDEEADAVTMMTMHSAKGLEFDTVFLVGAEEGLFPSYRSMEKNEELEEERRICYVAMTRAKKELYISCARRRMLYGQTSFAKPSRFIGEIPESCLQREEACQPSLQGARTPRPAPARRAPRPRPDVSVAPPVSSHGGTVQSFRPGDRIVHKVFGAGTVKNATPMGGDMLLEIAFEGSGTKLMMAKTASQYIQIL